MNKANKEKCTVLHTNGKGYWTQKAREVLVTDIELDGGELRVFFDRSSWDNQAYGLIYTDPLFLSELKVHLARIGLSIDVDYSEAGMQGDNYVSFDVD